MHENRSGSAALFSLVREAFRSGLCFCFEEVKKKILKFGTDDHTCSGVNAAGFGPLHLLSS
jgi:hypothetical protein